MSGRPDIGGPLLKMRRREVAAAPTAPSSSPRSAGASGRRGWWRCGCRPRSSSMWTGPVTSRASRSASFAGTMRSCRPFTMKIGQVMFLATPSSDSVAAFLRRLVPFCSGCARGTPRVSARQAVPRLAPVERPAEREAGLDALVERGGARSVIAAEAHAPHADARWSRDRLRVSM